MVTTEHANTAERAIRTFENMLDKRMEVLKKKRGEGIDQWDGSVLRNILDVYNNKDVHSSIKMTPAEGRMIKNDAIVKANLQVLQSMQRQIDEQ